MRFFTGEGELEIEGDFHVAVRLDEMFGGGSHW